MSPGKLRKYLKYDHDRFRRKVPVRGKPGEFVMMTNRKLSPEEYKALQSVVRADIERYNRLKYRGNPLKVAPRV